MAKSNLGISLTAAAAAFALGFLGCGTVDEPTASHKLCQQAPSDLAQAGFESYEAVGQYLEHNGVVMVNEVSWSHRVQFAYELRKFPAPLLQYLAKRDVKIRIMNGRGVGEDPTFPAFEKTGKDERRWRGVPGSGGDPTRIVANRLYEGHGCASLVLHEHAHTLDLVGVPGREGQISKDPEWLAIMAEDPVYQDFAKKQCGDYCGDPVEAFAETFALYHACSESRAIVQKSARVTRFFESLTTAVQKGF